MVARIVEGQPHAGAGSCTLVNPDVSGLLLNGVEDALPVGSDTRGFDLAGRRDLGELTVAVSIDPNERTLSTRQLGRGQEQRRTVGIERVRRVGLRDEHRLKVLSDDSLRAADGELFEVEGGCPQIVVPHEQDVTRFTVGRVVGILDQGSVATRREVEQGDLGGSSCPVGLGALAGLGPRSSRSPQAEEDATASR